VGIATNTAAAARGPWAEMQSPVDGSGAHAAAAWFQHPMAAAFQPVGSTAPLSSRASMPLGPTPPPPRAGPRARSSGSSNGVLPAMRTPRGAHGSSALLPSLPATAVPVAPIAAAQVEAYTAYYNHILPKKRGAGIIQPPLPSSLALAAALAESAALQPYRQPPTRIVPRPSPLEAVAARRKAEKAARARQRERGERHVAHAPMQPQQFQPQFQMEEEEFLIQPGVAESKEALPTPAVAGSEDPVEALAASMFFPTLSTLSLSPSSNRLSVQPVRSHRSSAAGSVSASGRASLNPSMLSTPAASPRSMKTHFTAPFQQQQQQSPHRQPAPPSAPLLAIPQPMALHTIPPMLPVPHLAPSADVAHLKALMQQPQPVPSNAEQSSSPAPASVQLEQANAYLKQFEVQPEQAPERDAPSAEEARSPERSPSSPTAAPKSQLSAAPNSSATTGASPTVAASLPPARSPRTAGPSPAALAAAAAAAAANAEAVELYKQQKAEAKARQAEEKAQEEAERKRKANEDLARRMRIELEEAEQRRLAEAEQARLQAHERREKARKLAESLQQRRIEMADKHAERRQAEKERVAALQADSSARESEAPAAVLVTVSPEAPISVVNASSISSASSSSVDDFMSHVDPLIRALKKADTASFEAQLMAKWAQLLYNEKNKEDAAEREAARIERERKAANQAAIAAVLEKADRMQAGLKKLVPSTASSSMLPTSDDETPQIAASAVDPTDAGVTQPASALSESELESESESENGAARVSTANGKSMDKRRTKRATARLNSYQSGSSVTSLPASAGGAGAGLTLNLSADPVPAPEVAQTPGSARRALPFTLPRPAQKVRVTVSLPEVLEAIARVRKAAQLAQPTSAAAQAVDGAVSPRATESRTSLSRPQSTLPHARTGSTSTSSFFSASTSAAEQEAWRRFCAFLERRDANGSTILHHAIWRRQPSMVPLLIKMGATSLLHATDNMRCTPLHLACLRGNEAVIADLVTAGAPINVPNVKGKLCFELPASTELADVVRITTALQRNVQQQMDAGSHFYASEDIEPLNAYVTRKTLQLMEAENEAARQAAAAAAGGAPEDDKADAAPVPASRSTRRKTFTSEQAAAATEAATAAAGKEIPSSSAATVAAPMSRSKQRRRTNSRPANKAASVDLTPVQSVVPLPNAEVAAAQGKSNSTDNNKPTAESGEPTLTVPAAVAAAALPTSTLADGAATTAAAPVDGTPAKPVFRIKLKASPATAPTPAGDNAQQQA